MEQEKTKFQRLLDKVHNNTVLVIILLIFLVLPSVKPVFESVEFLYSFGKDIYQSKFPEQFNEEKNTLNIILYNFTRVEEDLSVDLKFEDALTNRFNELIGKGLEIQFIYDDKHCPVGYEEAIYTAKKRNAQLVIFGNFFEKSQQVEIKYAYITQVLSVLLFNDSLVLFEGTNYDGDSIITFNYKNTTGIMDFKNLSEVSNLYNTRILKKIDFLVYSFLAIKNYEEKKLDKCIELAELAPLGDEINDLGAINVLSLCYEEKGETLKLLNYCNKLVSLRPNSYEAYLRRAQCYFDLRDYTKAMKDCKASLKLEPKSGRALTLKGNIYSVLGNEKEAIVNFNRALQIDTINLNALMSRSISYKNMEKYDLAIIDLGKYIKMDRNSAGAYMNRGVCFRRVNKIDDALHDFNKAIELDSNNHLIYYNRGSLFYQNLKKIDEAIQDFTKVISKDSSFYNAYLFRYYCFIEVQNHEKQIEDLSSLIKLRPNNADFHNRRGYNYILLKNYESAIKDFDKAIEIDNKFAFAYNNRGWANAQLGNYDKAFSDYQISSKLLPSNEYIFVFRGLTYFKKGSYKEALRDLNKVQPKHKEYKEEIKNAINAINAMNK